MAANRSGRITKRIVDQTNARDARRYLWDGELRGFGVQIERSGTKTYIVRYRPNGGGRNAPRRYFKIGRHGELTADEARERAKQILGRVAAGDDPAVERKHLKRENSDAITFAQLVQLFLSEHIRPKRKASTASTYEQLLNKHALPSLGERQAKSITRVDVAQLHLSLSRVPKSANRLIAIISSVFGFAGKSGLVPEGVNPARGIEKYREEARQRYLKQNELRRLGEALIEAETHGIPWMIDNDNPNSKHVPKKYNGRRQVLDPYAVAAIRLLLFTGARVREILDLRWGEVDFDRNLLFLSDSKTGQKTIVLNTAAARLIGELRVRADNTASDAFVIPGLIDGQPRADLKKPWNAIRRQAGLQDARLHDLRHTFASIGAGARLGLPVVGRLLGHSQPQTTARYAHLDVDPLKRAADEIGERIAEAMGSAITI